MGGNPCKYYSASVGTLFSKLEHLVFNFQYIFVLTLALVLLRLITALKESVQNRYDVSQLDRAKSRPL